MLIHSSVDIQMDFSQKIFLAPVLTNLVLCPYSFCKQGFLGRVAYETGEGEVCGKSRQLLVEPLHGWVTGPPLGLISLPIK